VFKVQAEVLNENSQKIHLTVSMDEGGVFISALGPKSTRDSLWTRREAEKIRDLLDIVLRSEDY
jgi:hypothetical protein